MLTRGTASDSLIRLFFRCDPVHLIGLLPSSQYPNTRRESVYWREYAPFQPVDLLHHIQNKLRSHKRAANGALHYIYCIYTFGVVYFFSFFPASCGGFIPWTTSGSVPSVRTVQVRLRHIHERVNRLPTASSGCVSLTLRDLLHYDFIGINMMTWTLIIWFLTSCKRADCLFVVGLRLF